MVQHNPTLNLFKGQGAVMSVAVSGDGDMVAAGTARDEVRVRDLTDDSSVECRVLPYKPASGRLPLLWRGGGQTLTFSPDCRCLLLVGELWWLLDFETDGPEATRRGL